MKDYYAEHDIQLIRRMFAKKPREIPFKSQNYALFKLGMYGNKALTWDSYKEILDSGWKGKVCMRSKKGIARGKTEYNLDINEVPGIIEDWKELGIPEYMISFNQSMPDEHLVIQGEVSRSTFHHRGKLYLYYSTAKLPMNQALNIKAETATGLKVLCLLKGNLDPSSFQIWKP